MQAKRPSLPAHPEDVERFFLERSADCHRHTLAVYRWAISRVHRICGCPDPCLDVYVEDRLKAITRQKVRLGEGIKQATPFNEQHLITLTEIWQDHAQIKLRRNLALLAVAYESMLRASELVRIRFADLSWQADGTAVVTIPISKTNHSGEPDTVLLSPDVVRLLKAYLHAAQLTSRPEAYVFVGVSKHNRALLPKRDPQTGTYRDRALSTKTIEGIFQAAWQELELHGESPFTAHSARVGATQDLLRKGYPTLQIQQSGRWASGTMVMRYGRAILARDSAMAKNRMAPKPHMDEE